jgi:endonuclease/exonuclease/phosphatase family metal-dependent hydrolase
MVEWSKRVDGIAQKILGSNADVVCLQEVLDAELAEQMKQKLQAKYKHIYYHIGGSSYRLGSGLFVASQFPIGNFAFTPFATEGIGQFKMHYKGFVSGTIQGADKKLSFIATHTCAGSPEASKNVREKQIQQIQAFAKKKMSICIGDFNVDRNGNEWENSSLKTQFRRDETFTDFTATDKYKYEMFDNDPAPAPQEKLDDVCQPKNGSFNISAQVFNSESLSDHHGVLAKVTV